MKKIFVIFLLFFSVYYETFAFEAELITDKNIFKKYEKIKATIKVKDLEDFSNLSFLKINLDKNLEITWNSQSSKTMYQSKIINWKLEEKREMQLEIDLLLKSKKEWEFEIWPFILTDWKTEFTTNSLKIKVLENENLADKSNVKEKEKINFEIEYLNYILFFVIVLFWFLLIIKFLMKNNFNKKELKNPEQPKLLPQALDLKNKNFLLELNNEDFTFEIEQFLKKYILFKYDLNFENKNISEILEEKNVSKIDLDYLRKINNSLDKINYSNLEVDKQEILTDLEHFLEK